MYLTHNIYQMHDLGNGYSSLHQCDISNEVLAALHNLISRKQSKYIIKCAKTGRGMWQNINALPPINQPHIKINALVWIYCRLKGIAYYFSGHGGKPDSLSARCVLIQYIFIPLSSKVIVLQIVNCMYFRYSILHYAYINI